MARGNTENLKPQNTRTKEEQRIIAKKGGIASGKSRKARKSFKEELLILLANGDTQKNLTIAMLQKAAQGDTKAFEVIRDTVGEKPTEKLDLGQAKDKPFEVNIKVIE